MALSTTTARNSVKVRLDIDTAITTWDNLINEIVLTAVGCLWPRAAIEVAAQTKTITRDDYGEATVDLSTLTTPVSAARLVEASTSDGRYFQVMDTYQHGTILRLRDLPSGTITVKIWGINPYILTNVPDNLFLAVYWFAMSEFYDFLQGNKRQYSLYVNGGARAVDNMADESLRYQQRAEELLEEQRTVY